MKEENDFDSKVKEEMKKEWDELEFHMCTIYELRKPCTLESLLDVGHGKFDKNNKHRALNKRGAWKNLQKNP